MGKTKITDEKQKIIAISKVFARAKTSMTLPEQKTFAYALAQIRYSENNQSNIISMNKKALAKILGINSDIDHLSHDIYRAIKDITSHSHVEFKGDDGVGFKNSFIIYDVDVRKVGVVELRIHEEFMSLFTGLRKNYITLWTTDIYNMHSEKSVLFYENLRYRTYSEGENSVVLSDSELKTIFRLEQNAYNESTGKFNRNKFEKRVIDPVCQDLSKSKMITITKQSNGQFYEKVKKGKRVEGYRFTWVYTKNPLIE